MKKAESAHTFTILLSVLLSVFCFLFCFLFCFPMEDTPMLYVLLSALLLLSLIQWLIEEV